MKNYKKGLLVAAVLSTMSLMAAESKVIQVTTFEDEDGENLSKCSLREAVRTAYENKSYGGCNAGNLLVGMEDYIQLEAGEYKLNAELIPRTPLLIYGTVPYDGQRKNELTGKYPAKEQLKTVINAQGKSRIFNTAVNGTALDLNNILLKNGQATTTAEDLGHGGALYIGGRLNLFNSSIFDSNADGEGGAIYFTGKTTASSLSISGAHFDGNTAKNGAVFSMECFSSLKPVRVDMDWSFLSVTNNGDARSKSIIDFCGQINLGLSVSTIAKNTVGGHETAAVIRAVSDDDHPLDTNGYLSFTSNTIVENQGPALAYDNFGMKLFNSNIIAFNHAANGNCIYTKNNGDPSEDQKISLSAGNNALAANCHFPAITLNEGSRNKIIHTTQLESLLSPFKAASPYNAFLPLYYPKNLGTEDDLVDAGHTNGCSVVDQRGISRVTTGTLIFNPTLQNTCDIGSVELMRLTAADIVGLKNVSYPDLVSMYERDIERFKEMIKDPANKNELLQIQDELANDEAALAALKKYVKYRGIYVDPFELALPSEIGDPTNGELRLKALNADDYLVTTEVIGVGQLNGVANGEPVLSGEEDPNLKCEWNAEMKRVIMYRTDSKPTSSTDTEYCKYTLTDKVTQQSSTGVIAVVFTNLAPVAVDDTYRISPDSDLRITVNPLENDHDDADGPMDSLTEKRNNKFFVNFEGNETPIRFERIPSGLSMTAERQGPCPDTHIRDTCYGGKITFEAKNNFSQFDYAINYNVFDADGAASPLATIRLLNTVTNTSTSSSGGGSLGFYSVISLVGLILYRRFRV